MGQRRRGSAVERKGPKGSKGGPLQAEHSRRPSQRNSMKQFRVFLGWTNPESFQCLVRMLSVVLLGLKERAVETCGLTAS